MFQPGRIIILVIISIALTTALYFIDSDPPSDTFFQRAINTTIVFGILLLFYGAGYGLLKVLRKRTGHRAI